MRTAYYQCFLAAWVVVLVAGDNYGYEADDYDDYDDNFSAAPRATKASSSVPFVVEHSFSGFEEDFTERLRLAVKMNHYSGKPSVSVTHSAKLTDSQIDQLQTLVENESYYRLRLRSLASNAPPTYVGAAVPACRLVASDFMDDVALHLDANGAAIGLEYHTAVPPGKSEFCDGGSVSKDLAVLNAGQAFKTGAYIVVPQPVSTVPMQPPSKAGKAQASSFPPLPPPMGVHVLKDGSPGGGPGGQPQEQQSFLRRYAYVIIPLVLILLLGGGPEEPEGAAGAGGGGGGQRAAPRGGGGGGGGGRRR